MNQKIVRIERVTPRDGVAEAPLVTTKGYQLGDPSFGSRKHHAEHAVHVATLEDAAGLVRQGFSLWMTSKGKRPSLVSPSGLRIVAD